MRRRFCCSICLLLGTVWNAAAVAQQPAYNPAGAIDPRLQQQLTPAQQQQLQLQQQQILQQQQRFEQQRQQQLRQQQPQQPNQLQPNQLPQRDPRFAPAQYQPGNGPNGQPVQLQPGQVQPLPGQLPPSNPNQLSPLQPGQPQPLVQLQPARAPFELTPQQIAELDKALTAWEQTSGSVKTFEAKFTRWEYDPVFGPPNTHKTESAGEVKYQAPDRGLFQITETKLYNAGTKQYDATNDLTQKEYWLCDGQFMFQLKHEVKQLVKTELPPNMRGVQIADGPLPFVFGQKKDKLKERFWVRVVTPANVTNQIWLEAFPKYQSDAANYKKVDLILDGKTLNPLAIQTHDPSPTSSARMVYQFANHSVNSPWVNINVFRGFIQPEVPSGYKLFEERYREPSTVQTPPQPGTMPRK